MKRWRVVVRSNRGAYTTDYFVFRRSAQKFANDVEQRGLGVAIWATPIRATSRRRMRNPRKLLELARRAKVARR